MNRSRRTPASAERNVHGLIPQAPLSSPIYRANSETHYEMVRVLYGRLRGIGLLDQLPQAAPCDLSVPPIRLVRRFAADYVLRPMLVGKDTKLPDYVVLISTLGGIAVFGANGFVIGPVIAALFVAAWEIYTASRLTDAAVVSAPLLPAPDASGLPEPDRPLPPPEVADSGS